jgi:hypothetical protein
MKKITIVSFLKPAWFISMLLIVSFSAKAQDSSKLVASFPDSVNKIITASCTPCHTNDGGEMAKSKLNFSDWNKYSDTKQKQKATKMYSELNKGGMPPKSARQKHPELIPTADQIAVIKRWSETYAPSK